MKRNTLTDVRLTATLNDLLQLDVDAVQAYALAIRQLDSKQRKAAVRRYQADHRRHIKELRTLIREHGGAPVAVSHIPTGPFKLAMQALGSDGAQAGACRGHRGGGDGSGWCSARYEAAGIAARWLRKALVPAGPVPTAAA